MAEEFDEAELRAIVARAKAEIDRLKRDVERGHLNQGELKDGLKKVHEELREIDIHIGKR